MTNPYIPLFIAASLFKLSDASTPRAIEWSPSTYGPDGPWQAVRVEIGTPPQTIDLFPGGFFESVIYGSQLCTTVCDAQKAGTYNSASSSTAVTGLFGPPVLVNATLDPFLLGVNATYIFDTINLPTVVGDQGGTITGFDMQVWTSGYNVLPGGLKYGLQVGNLALGAQDPNQTWPGASGQPNTNGTLLPSGLFAQGLVPSNSYGLHIGSASLGIPGSLFIGGYDQTRVLGEVTTQPYGLNFLAIDLLDISIGVAVGNSPFAFTSKIGLLASGSTTITHSLTTRIDSGPPYIQLPRSSCDAIASELPVTYRADFGLYFWNTTDPMYEKIISSPSYLGFTFRLNDSSSQNVTIRVPFSLLNLTLTSPLVTQDTQYFPCSPVTAGSPPTLGKAFLSAAFVGVTWQTNHDGVWFLAQAPGPNTASASLARVVAIQPTDKFIVPSDNSWVDTWKDTWKPIGNEVVNVNSTTPASIPSPTPSSASSGSSSATSAPGSSKSISLSGIAIAGISIGALVLAALIAALVFLLLRRRTKIPVAVVDEVVPEPPMVATDMRQAGFGPREVEGVEINSNGWRVHPIGFEQKYTSELNGDARHYKPNQRGGSVYEM